MRRLAAERLFEAAARTSQSPAPLKGIEDIKDRFSLEKRENQLDLIEFSSVKVPVEAKPINSYSAKLLFAFPARPTLDCEVDAHVLVPVTLIPGQSI